MFVEKVDSVSYAALNPTDSLDTYPILVDDSPSVSFLLISKCWSVYLFHPPTYIVIEFPLSSLGLCLNTMDGCLILLISLLGLSATALLAPKNNSVSLLEILRSSKGPNT